MTEYGVYDGSDRDQPIATTDTLRKARYIAVEAETVPPTEVENLDGEREDQMDDSKQRIACAVGVLLVTIFAPFYIGWMLITRAFAEEEGIPTNREQDDIRF